MNDHRDEVRVVERGGGAVINRIIEAPVRRPKLPEEPAKLVAVLFQAGPATLTMEVVLVPQAKLVFWRLWLDRSGNVLNVVAAPRYQPACSLGPQGSDDAGHTASPIVAGEHTVLDLQRVHEREKVAGERRLLSRP